MTSKIVVGPIDHGLKKDRTAFVINNDSFPTLINAYQWRGRVKRKRGTSLLTRLRRYFNSTNLSYSSTATIALDGSGIANILTGFGLQSTGNIIPGTVTITIGVNVYTDPTVDGYLTPTGTGGLNTIVYSTGVITIPGEAGNSASVVFSYYPGLPVMGLEEFVFDTDQFPGTIGFDAKYAYNIVNASPYPSYDISFYKNPPLTAILTLYGPKASPTPTSWNGQDYQQFWTVNYQGALWATNGINVPFSITNIGMQYRLIEAIDPIYAVGPPGIIKITITNHGLVNGDFIFLNEIGGLTGVNFQTAYVQVLDPNTFNAILQNAVIGGAYTSGGIVQYLTNRSDVTVDNIRWYDGDPTDGNITTPTLSGHKGWVNFMPPLSQSAYSIAGLPPAIYYLIGARMIVPFKDRLLFFGPVVQTSAAGSQIYLQDTVIYSENGTTYYTASFEGDPRFPTNIIPILVPENQTAFPAAYFEDSAGFGGFIESTIDEPILSVSTNEDSLIVGFTTNQTRFVYTGNDIVPFNFYLINSELGTSSTFSAINMDRGVISRGSRGYIITSQTECRRIDLDNPDQVFEIRLIDNGPERICSQRDFINEWIYFTYPSNQNADDKYRFPTQTFQYNYRDDTWAIFNETYTTYGSFRKRTGFIWSTVGLVYPTWSSWNVPWNAGSSTLLQPEVIAGNQQGFVLVRDDGTDEGNSLSIKSISGSTVISINHSLNNDDFIVISGVLGTLSSQLNGKIFQVQVLTKDTFVLDPNITSGTYFGGGLIKRMYVPFIQTKQFPVAWGDARKTRIGVQRYLFTKTENAQITLQIFLSQDEEGPYNRGPIIPGLNVVNGSLIYSSVLYTCPESTNLGLTPANINLMTPTATSQSQIWHRMNTSLIGDTVQIGFTMSESQMRELRPFGPIVNITDISQSTQAVVTADNNFSIGQLVIIEDVEGMIELNGNIYYIVAVTDTDFTIDVDTTGFIAYDTGGTAQKVGFINQFAEIELHGFILDATPSQMLI